MPAHLVEARVDHLVDDDDFLRVADADARAEGGDSGIGAAIWLQSPMQINGLDGSLMIEWE